MSKTIEERFGAAMRCALELCERGTQARIAKMTNTMSADLSQIVGKDKGTSEDRRLRIFEALLTELTAQGVYFPVDEYALFLKFGDMLPPKERQTPEGLRDIFTALEVTRRTIARRILGQPSPQERKSTATIETFTTSVGKWMQHQCGDNPQSVLAVIKRFTDAFEDYSAWLSNPDAHANETRTSGIGA